MLHAPRVCRQILYASPWCEDGLVRLLAGAPRTKAGHANVVLIIIAVICGVAFAGAAVFAVYQHRRLQAVKQDGLHNGYISLNTVGRDSA